MKNTLLNRIVIAGFIGFILMVVNDFFLPYNPLLTVLNFFMYWAVSCLFVSVVEDFLEKKKNLRTALEVIFAISSLTLIESFSFLISRPLKEQTDSGLLFSIFGFSFVIFIFVYCILGVIDDISKREK